MNCVEHNLKFSQLHIDVARNATDDFNLFHDPHRWNLIAGNPFDGPITLGFQLESLVEREINSYRYHHDEEKFLADKKLRFSNYQFAFANAIKPGQSIRVDIKKTQIRDDPNFILSNRVCIKSDEKIAITGFKKETSSPLFLTESEFSNIQGLSVKPDRSFLENGFFLKRKFMNASNAKNFLCGSFSDQTLYFDELTDKYNYPEIFPCSLISCALLERAQKNQHDFKKNPMVYSTHKISIDRYYLKQLRSNDALQILVKPKELTGKNKESMSTEQCYECYGVMNNGNILFRALISLLPLYVILESLEKKNLSGSN